MALAPDSKIGPYRIVELIGTGGMGEVYRARDDRLGRSVAVKVLPESFASDPGRRERFEREAQAVAALSHPNIVAVFDTGLHEGRAFVVMELCEGETLRERLNAGALPLSKAIDIGVQFARGLGAAHGKQIVHRDLKPENVFLLSDGQVKILDFGLARHTQDDAGGSAQTMAATDPGTVMGTVGYMAPEQLRAQAVDARADLFAFGAVLYEMVGGKPAFRRETSADTNSAILNEDPPDLAGLRPELSPALDRIVRHCLEKNPNERFQSARDVAFALEALSGSQASSGASLAVPTAPAVGRRTPSAVALVGVAIAAVALGVLVRGLFGTPAAGPWQFTIKTFERQSIFNARFMPDGETVVFSSALSGNTPGLFELRPGALEARPFGPPRTHLLSVSSTGELAVLVDAHYLNHRLFRGTLARMTLEGAPRPMVERVREADWSPDGSALAIIRDTGTTDELEYPVGTRLYASTGYLSDPRVSPDGGRVAFMEHPARYDDRGFVRVVDAAGTVTTLAGEHWGEEGIAWSLDGQSLLFGATVRPGSGREESASSQQVYRVAADGSEPPALWLTSPAEVTILDVSSEGRLLATQDEVQYGVLARGAGQPEERDLSYLDLNWNSSLSSDGTRLLFSDGRGGPDYSVVWRTTDGSPVVRLGPGESRGFSPDGRWALAFLYSTSQVVAYPIGPGEPVYLDTSAFAHIENTLWYFDSTSIILWAREPGQPQRVYRLAIDGGPPVAVMPPDVAAAIFSPDGSRAVGVTASGEWAVYPADGGPARPLPAIEPTDAPFGWTADGRAVVVQRGSDVPARIDRVDAATGDRTPFIEQSASDLVGLTLAEMRETVVPADGSRYSYRYLRRLSTLFFATRETR